MSRILLVACILASGCMTPVKPSDCIEFCKPWDAVGRYGTFNQSCDCRPPASSRSEGTP